MLLTEDRNYEEWPSERWNFQDNYGKSISKVTAKKNPEYGDDESAEAAESDVILDEDKMTEVLTSVKGIGKKKSEKILDKFDLHELVHALENEPKKLMKKISWMKSHLLDELTSEWNSFKKKL